MRSRAALFVVFALAACDSPGSESADASTAPDAVVTTEPIAPTPPRLTPCPDGWSIAMRDEIAICEPTPESAETCTGATFRLPGRASCEPVDDACETSLFPTGLDASRAIRYVRAGASGGDGSEAAPFATIAQALASTTEPLTIALAAGEYTTEAALPADLEIRGVCAETVVLTHDDATEPALRVMRGSRLVIEGVTMRTGDVALLSGGDLVVRSVAIEGAATAGIAMIGGSLEASRVSIRDTRTDADGRLGRGLSFESGTHAQVDTIVIEGSHDNGIGAGRDVVIEGRVIAVRDTSPNGAGRFGSAIGLYERSSAMLREVAIERASEGGVIVDEGSELTLEDAVVRDVVSEASMANGRGVFVRASTARVRRTLIERASGAAIYATDHATLELSDVVCASTRLSGDFAAGLGVIDGTVATVDRFAVLDAAWMGIVTLANDASLDARDVIVRRVEIAQNLGEGIVAGETAHVSITRLGIEDAHALGAMAYGAGTTMSLTDARIHRVLETTVHGVGRGVEADVGATITLVRAVIDDVVDTGVVSFGMLEPGTHVSLEDVRITNVRERSCARSTCPTEGGGSGVAAVFGGVITARGLEVIGAPLCGVQVAEGGSLDLESGTIRESSIGACVQIEGYDLARVVEGVEYRDNERNVESASVYVPGRGPS